MPRRYAESIKATTTKNVASIDPVAAAGLVWRVKGSSFTLNGVNIEPRVALCLGATASEFQERNATLFRALTYVFAIRLETWDLQLADRGFHELDGSRD